MRILGIDCGTERTGYGVVESDGRSHGYIDAGVVHGPQSAELSERLRIIASSLRRVIDAAQPDAVAVEGVFHSLNAKTALKLAHVRGVALLVAAEAGLPVSEYSPLEVKRSVVGYGRAEKEQVALMVRSLLRTDREFSHHDATDALAIAICHATLASTPATAGVRTCK